MIVDLVLRLLNIRSGYKKGDPLFIDGSVTRYLYSVVMVVEVWDTTSLVCFQFLFVFNDSIVSLSFWDSLNDV